MVRLTDLPDYERDHLLAKNLPPLGPPVWTTPTRPLSQMRLALVTTAGLHYRDDPAFELAEDVNIVFPLGRFRELVERGVVGSLADVHYSFMGAGLPPHAYESSGRSGGRHVEAGSARCPLKAEFTMTDDT